MSSIRCVVGFLFIAALFFTAMGGECAEQNIDQQIAERLKHYQESLRRRAAQISPSFQTRIETQVKQTVSKALAQWRSGEISIHVALPRLAEAKRMDQFISRHLPSSNSPGHSFEFGNGTLTAALTSVPVQHIVKSSPILAMNGASEHGFTSVQSPMRDVLSYFIRIVCTIVLLR